MERSIVHQDDLARVELGEQNVLKPSVEHERVTRALKSHQGQQLRLPKGRDETDAVRVSARDLSEHLRATWRPRIGTMQGVIHPTFVQIDKVMRLPVSQLFLKLRARWLVSFGVLQGFFFA